MKVYGVYLDDPYGSLEALFANEADAQACADMLTEKSRQEVQKWQEEEPEFRYEPDKFFVVELTVHDSLTEWAMPNRQTKEPA